MKYRPYGKAGFEVSALGFGCMRLPMKKDGKTVDADEAIAMMHYAINNGVNYFDTAFGYHSGESELILGRALRDGYREKVKVATKLPVWDVKKAEDFDRILAKQLEKLGVGHIDVYLLHGLGRDSIKTIKECKLLDKLDVAMGDGRIKNAGFSFHDDFDCLKDIVNMYDNWSMAQVQFNYLNKNDEPGEKGVKFLADKGLAAVAMVPCQGGNLANLPHQAMVAFEGSDKKRTVVQWAYDWVWNYPEITMVLSGMSSMQQVKDNIVYAKESGVGCMSASDVSRVEKAVELIGTVPQIPCTMCKYCMPCPQNVNIAACMAAMNEGSKFGKDAALNVYKWWMSEKEHAEFCNSCGTCEAKCPQKIKISEEISKIAEYIAKIK